MIDERGKEVDGYYVFINGLTFPTHILFRKILATNTINMSNTFAECSKCGKTINYGNAYVTILRNIEQADFDLISNQDEIEIIDSREIITLCGNCGNAFDTETLGKLIESIPFGNNKPIDN